MASQSQTTESWKSVFANMAKLPPLNHPWHDATHSPLGIVTYPAASSEADITSFFDAAERWMHSVHSPWVVIIDFSQYDAKASTVGKRKAFADGANKLKSLLEQHCRGVAIVAPSAIMRGVATAVLSIFKTPCPIELVASLDEALSWSAHQADR